MQKLKNTPGASEEEIPESDQIQIRGLVYESHLIRKQILAYQQLARKNLNRPVWIVENLSYGAVALAPITVERPNGKFIVGTNIPVIGTKIGSTESHHNEYVVREDLFTTAQVRQLLELQPVLLVVDGSSSIRLADDQKSHIPDASKGYRNYFMALNKALGFRIVPEDFAVDQDFVNRIESSQGFIHLVSKLSKIVSEVGFVNRKGYRFKYWWPGNKTLHFRENLVVKGPVPKILSPQEIHGPTAIFMQSGIEPRAVDQNVMRDYIKGIFASCIFDDTDHYRRFTLTYRKGYGLVPSKKYMDFSRQEYRRLLEYLKENIPDEMLRGHLPPALAANQQVDTIVLDLDGTIARLGLAPSPQMIARLAALLKKGKRVVIVTDDSLENAKSRLRKLIDGLPSFAKANLYIFANSATKGLSFDRHDGHEIEISGYNSQSSLSSQEQSLIKRIIQTEYHGQVIFEDQDDMDRIQLSVPEGVGRDLMIERVGQLLQAEGLSMKCYKSGGHRLRLVRQHKEHAVEYMVRNFDVDPERMLIMADAGGFNQMDHRLLTFFVSAINVDVTQLPGLLNGIAGAQKILDILDQTDQVPHENLMSLRPLQTAGVDAAMGHQVSKLADFKGQIIRLRQAKNLGGIDLSSANMNLQTQNSDGEIKFSLDAAMLQQLQNAPGFVPVIINIQSMTNLRQFLDLIDSPTLKTG